MTALRRNYGCRINDELRYKGLKSIIMENELIRVFILLEKGTDILEFVYKPLDLDFLWKSPKDFKEGQLNRENFLETYLGGWQEIIPNGGSPCVYKGASFNLHDESSMVSWDYEILEDRDEKISIKFFTKLNKIPLQIKKTITLESNTAVLSINEEVINLSNEKLDFMWGHHPCFGSPFISEDCLINFIAEEIVSNPFSISNFPLVKPDSKGTLKKFPSANGSFVDLSKVLGKDAKVADLLYAKDLKQNWFTITNLKKKVGIGFLFDEKIFKYLYIWLVYNGSNNYPWYSNTYSLAIEPWSSYPGLGLLEAIKNGTSLEILPQEIKTAWLKVFIYEKDTDVVRVDDNCNVY